MKPHAVIVDDHPLFSAALARLIEPHCDVIGLYQDPHVFLREAARLKTDLALLDVSMPGMSGLDAGRELLKIVPQTRIIFLTVNEDPDVVVEAFRLGAAGYLLKRSTPSELQTAVRHALQHQVYVTPLLTQALMQTILDGPPGDQAALRLTERQRDVLRLLAKGHSMKAVGAILNVSARTVAFHKYRLMTRLNVRTTAELIQYAVRAGLV